MSAELSGCSSWLVLWPFANAAKVVSSSLARGFRAPEWTGRFSLGTLVSSYGKTEEKPNSVPTKEIFEKVVITCDSIIVVDVLIIHVHSDIFPHECVFVRFFSELFKERTSLSLVYLKCKSTYFSKRKCPLSVFNYDISSGISTN